MEDVKCRKESRERKVVNKWVLHMNIEYTKEENLEA